MPPPEPPGAAPRPGLLPPADPPEPQRSVAKPCEGAQIVAKVGRHVILEGELDAAANQFLLENQRRITPEEREMLKRQLLRQQIELKLVLEDALREIPQENLEKIRESLTEQFEETELPKRMERAGVRSRLELERKLRQVGSSVEREKRAFIEQAIAQYHIGQVLLPVTEKSISPEEVLAEYQRNIADYRHKARARWEQLTVRKSNHPDPAGARTKLAMMGNQVINGAPFAEVARAYSEESGAARGGQHDWVTRGSLVSEVLDQAIFGLPVGRLSQILEDDEGYHIIRVLERQEAYTTPFVEAQLEIRKRLVREKRKKRLAEYISQLREEIPVWTIYDDERSADRRSSSGAAVPRW